MSIRIVNLRNYRPVAGEILIKVDRSSPLGNPFYMKHEGMRDEVCDKYEEYFNGIVSNYLNIVNNCLNNDCKLTQKEINFMDELIRIAKLSLTKDIALGCWCAPKRCHGETIKRFIEKHI